ncbi:hypothetical protein SME38J_04910 [Serratia marcescens]|nr:hypothetical protein SME38J_04910 [Serratia marcescens]
MSRIFEIVQEKSGHRNCITIPIPFLNFFAKDRQAHALAAVLNQLVFWSGKSDLENGWFYKEHADLAREICGVSEDQIHRLVKKLSTVWLPGIIQVKQAKIGGIKKTHYRVQGDALINAIFPASLDSVKSRDPNCEVAEPKPQSCGIGSVNLQNQNREIAESYLYTDHYTDHNKQIIKPLSEATKLDDFQTVEEKDSDTAYRANGEIIINVQAIRVLSHLNKLTGVKYKPGKETLQHIRARLRDGHTIDELKLVIDFLVERWLGTRFAKHLNPEAMFKPAKFPANLLGAQAWQTRGQPSEKVIDENLDYAKRDTAYQRFIGGALPSQKPDELELLVSRQANLEGVRNMKPHYSVSAWNRIWMNCASQLKRGQRA